LSLPDGVPSEDTFECVFKSINPDEQESCLHDYGNHILTDLSDKQTVTEGKKQRVVSPATR
jgi:uncharacterized protein YueI